MMDHTHDASARSWVAVPAESDFPIQNLPLGAFVPPSGGAPRCGTAIGDQALDLAGLARAGLLDPAWAETLSHPTLNAFLEQGAAARRSLRSRLFALLVSNSTAREAIEPHLSSLADCTLTLPVRIGGYTDFYAGIVHATNIGRLLRPDNPLMPNYKHVPIGYNGRASSIQASGAPIRRPSGQLKGAEEPNPTFGPSQRLDYEVELALWVGEGNELGNAVPLQRAREALAGVSLLNDWSARDIQAWEYQPLGPFLSKTFASTVSPWIVTAEALAPFRTSQAARPDGDPAPLPYLSDPDDQAQGALAIEIEVAILTAEMREGDLAPFRLGRTHARHLYWTPGQMLAHHTSNGCNLQVGDLLGTGTISAPGRDGFGSLMEVTFGGRERVTLPTGETRAFLEDGDEIVMTGRCVREGTASIGFGACRARLLPAASEDRQ